MYNPHLVFLSEPQIFQSDLSHCMDYFHGEYSFTLNSEDSHDPDLALLKTKSKGGTLAMWRQSLDPFLTIIPVDTSALLPVLLEVPNFQPSIHIGLYLPTAGNETEYLMELDDLEIPNSSNFYQGRCQFKPIQPKSPCSPDKLLPKPHVQENLSWA